METIKINLATFEYEDKHLSYPVMLLAALIVLIISSLSIRIGLNAQNEIKKYESKIEEKEQAVIKRQQIKNEKTFMLKDGEIESLKKDIEFINGLIKMDAYPYDRLLDSLELCVPKGVLLSSFEMSKDFKNMTLKGKADSMDNITIFLNKLNDSKIYKNNNLLKLSVSQAISFQEESISTNNGITFEIECSIAEDEIWSKG